MKRSGLNVYVETMKQERRRPLTDPLIKQVARFTLEHKSGQEPLISQAIDGITRAVKGDDHLQDLLGLPKADAVTVDDIVAALYLIEHQRFHTDHDERELIEAAKDRGETWEQLGQRLGRSSQAMQQRYKRLGGTKSWPSPPPRRNSQRTPSP